MPFLGAFVAGQAIRITVTWTPDAGSTVTGSTMTCTHPDGTQVVVAGVAAGPTDAWRADVTLSKRGRWKVRWETAPVGGAREDVLYIS